MSMQTAVYPKTNLEVLQSLITHPALQPLPRRDTRPEACLRIGNFRHSSGDLRALVCEGAQLNFIVRTREEYNGITIGLLCARRGTVAS